LRFRTPLLIAAVAALPVLGGAQAPEPARDVPTFGVSTELVYVRFHIDRKKAYVDTVTKDQIRVLEDGHPQTVALLETPSTRQRTVAPEVTLALDVSSSVMDARLLDEELVKEVFLGSLQEQSRVALCAFGGQLRCPTPPTRDVDALMGGFQQAIDFGRETRGGGTRLYASLADICKKQDATRQSQRAMVVFSDGLDNRDGKVQEAIQAAADADVRVYAVKLSQAYQETAPRFFGRGGYGPPGNRALYDYKKLDLDRLAAETGGRAYEPGRLDRATMADILRSIGTELSMENVAGYQPQGAPTGQKHRIKVELVDKSLGSIHDGERTLVR
jgi:VWFA-related protein